MRWPAVGLNKYMWLIKAFLHAPWWVKKRLSKNYQKRRRYYKKEGAVGEIKNMLMCSLCPNMCRFDCPTSEAAKTESGAPATRSRFAYYLEMGMLQNETQSTRDDATKYTWLCADCDNCNVWCPMDLSVGKLNYGLRADLVKKGISPIFAQETKKMLEQEHNAFERLDFRKFDRKVANAEVFYFIGCVTAANHPDVIQANFKILDKAGIPFSTAITDRWCCGAPAWISGYQDLAQKHAQHNAATITSLQPKIVLFDCPECLHMWKTYYPQLGASIKAELLHTSEFFLRLVRQNKLKFRAREEKIAVTFHDPCVLGRKLDITSPPRELLSSIPGINFKEAYIHGKETHCCGYGGMLSYSWPQIAEQIGKKRLEELAHAGTNRIITACPSCETAFLKYDRDSEFEILDLSQVLADGLE